MIERMHEAKEVCSFVKYMRHWVQSTQIPNAIFTLARTYVLN